MENILLMTCLVLVIAAAGAKWQTAMMQKKRQRHIISMMSEREDIGRRRGVAELKVEEASLQERTTSSDIREFTHQLSVMEDRLVELREEEEELEERRQKHLDGDDD
ncbi:MAG: hypothetical protein HOM68_23785 [Gemmatimonadetes bacterium]|jgi:hypothetical protein|nr:hypothetical protein [Gemmatimonadota bacterium]MBT4610535.1 hypothetical protein [Gemmatimonadota bacterium]MBT5059588.1 hypothetical protein [Gemmatimonadota bacterium]MBT5144665.1 hypothetical protein [Gemmatimonadota bacterium]MBT5587374.1 hypothetical protein [Gemmatimonadota bacterium]